MSDAATPADRARPALKRDAPALDRGRGMRTQDLKLRIARAEYVIDPRAVADAMLRHAISHRRWWNPRADRLAPPADSTTSGGPSATDPIHVSDAAASSASRSRAAPQTQSS